VRKVPVQSEDFAGIEFVGEMNEACVGKIGRQVRILAHDISHWRCDARELKRNQKHSLGDVLQYHLGRTGNPSQQIATFGYHRFTGYQWARQFSDHLGAPPMVFLTSIKQRHDHSGVK